MSWLLWPMLLFPAELLSLLLLLVVANCSPLLLPWLLLSLMLKDDPIFCMMLAMLTFLRLRLILGRWRVLELKGSPPPPLSVEDDLIHGGKI